MILARPSHPCTPRTIIERPVARRGALIAWCAGGRVGSEALNIFQMYQRNGDRAGFWVRRNSWGSWSFAQVLTVQGRELGPLAGVGPYFNDDRGLNPIVEARIWYRGAVGVLEALSGPGTYAYVRIKAPADVLLAARGWGAVR